MPQALIKGLLYLSARLPLPTVHGLGALLGQLLWLFPTRTRRIAAINLALCFPQRNREARNWLLRQSLAETGKALLEIGSLWHWDPQYLFKKVEQSQNEKVLQQALAQGRGAILITPHLGSWELAGLYFSYRYSMTILYRPSRLGLDPLIRTGRGRLGARLVTTDRAGVRALVQTLRDNGVLGILPDQDPGRNNGVFAPFFGTPANTMTLVARLAIKTGTPVFLTYAERLRRGQGYRVHLWPLPKAMGREPLEQALAVMNGVIEQAVRQLPEQYLWGYKRFKTRPTGVPKLYEKTNYSCSTS